MEMEQQMPVTDSLKALQTLVGMKTDSPKAIEMLTVSFYFYFRTHRCHEEMHFLCFVFPEVGWDRWVGWLPTKPHQKETRKDWFHINSHRRHRYHAT
jgi:hypothetical protein